MPLDRSLWVQDAYAVRCWACARPFTLFRRRHHCRQCGQVFCRACLYCKPSVKAAADPPQRAPGVEAALAEKICDRCAGLLLRLPPATAPGASVLNTSTLSRAESPLARRAERSRSATASSTARGAYGAAVGGEHPSAVAVQRSEVRPEPEPEPEPVPRRHEETAAERLVSYAIADVARYRRMADLRRGGVQTWRTAHSHEREAREVLQCDGGASLRSPDLVDPLAAEADLVWRGRPILGEDAHLSASWVGAVLADYTRHMRRLWAGLGLPRTTAHMGGVMTATWRAVRATTCAWGSPLTDHVDVLSVTAPTPAPVALIPGIVLARRLTSSRMPALWQDRPRILLLGGDVGIPDTSSPPGRGGGAGGGWELAEYVSLYQGYLDKLFQRIQVWAPQVIVVEGGMHHYLQKRVADDGGMSLLLHVGRQDLTKLAGGCHASVVTDLQSVGLAELHQTSRSPLGVCESFRVVTAMSGEGAPASWCVFEGLPQSCRSTVVVCTGDEAARPAGTHAETGAALVAAVKDSLLVASHLLSLAHCATAAGLQLAAGAADGREAILHDAPLHSVNDLVSAALADPPETHHAGTAHPPTFGARALHAQRVLYELVGTEPATAAARESTEPAAAATSTRATEPLPRSDAAARTQAPRCFQLDTFTFYRPDEDVSLLDFLTAQCAEVDPPRFFWAHGTRRVTVRTASVPPSLTPPPPALTAPTLADPTGATLAYRRRGSEESLAGDRRPGAPVHAIYTRVECKACGVSDGMRSRWSPLSAGALATSLGALLACLLRGTVSFTHAVCGAPLEPPFSLVFLVAHDEAEEAARGSRRALPLMTVTLEVCQSPIFQLCAPPTTFGGTSAHAELQAETDELELDAVAVHSAILQCIADTEMETEAVVVLPDNPPSPQSSAAMGEPVPLPMGSPSHDASTTTTTTHHALASSALALTTLRARAAEIVAQARPSARSIDAVADMRWHRLRPLLADLRQWGARDAVPAGCEWVPPPWAAEWLFSVEDGVGLRRGDPATYVAAALRMRARVPGSPLTRTKIPLAPQEWVGEGGEGRGRHVRFVEPPSATSQAAAEASTTDLDWRTAARMRLRRAAAAPPTLGVQQVSRHVLRNLTSASAAPSSQIVVELYYPDEFAALYRLTMGDGAASLADSLQRSEVHRPEGGKTNAPFRITRDGRYLLKRIKTQELRHFPTWAARYFGHMAACDESSDADADTPACPSFLAKILGLFTVQVLTPRLAQTAPVEEDAGVASQPLSPVSAARSAPSAPSGGFHGAQGHPRVSAAVGALTPPLRPTSPVRRPEPSPWVGGERQHYVIMANTASHGPAQRPTATPTLRGDVRHSGGGAARPVVVGFDLKGSQRNRHAPAGSLVKLDADLVTEYLHQGHFLFCTPAQKGRLMKGLAQDVELLRAAGVMDYSLLVALESPASAPERTDAGRTDPLSAVSSPLHGPIPDTPVLHLSIIDYLHPFTGAKLLESRMKSGLDSVLGHAGRDPTIIDPAAYMERFLRWMSRYFCEVPEADSAEDEASHPTLLP